MTVLVVAASSSRVSINRHLALRLAGLLGEMGVATEYVDYALFDTMPHYNFDAERAHGLPAQAEELIGRIASASGLLMAVPEYNHAIPGTLKNGIDWISRRKPPVLRGKVILGASASPSVMGGWRGLQDLRLPMEALSAICMPDVVAIGAVRTAAEIDARLAEAEVASRIEAALSAFAGIVSRGEAGMTERGDRKHG